MSPGSGSGGGDSPFRPDATAGSPITLKWIIPHATARGEISYFPAGRAVIAAEFTQDRTLPANWIPGVAIPQRQSAEPETARSEWFLRSRVRSEAAPRFRALRGVGGLLSRFARQGVFQSAIARPSVAAHGHRRSDDALARGDERSKYGCVGLESRFSRED